MTTPPILAYNPNRQGIERWFASLEAAVPRLSGQAGPWCTAMYVHHTIDSPHCAGRGPAYGTINATIARLADKQMLARRYPKCRCSRAQEYRARVSEQEFVEIQVAALMRSMDVLVRMQQEFILTARGARSPSHSSTPSCADAPIRARPRPTMPRACFPSRALLPAIDALFARTGHRAALDTKRGTTSTNTICCFPAVGAR